MFLREIDHVRDLFESVNGTFVGVGMTAFPRIIPSYFSDSYPIITLRKTGDLPQLRKKTEIFCLEEETDGFFPVNVRDSARLLDHQVVKKYLDKLPDPKHLYCIRIILIWRDWPGKRAGSSWPTQRICVSGSGKGPFFNKWQQDLVFARSPGASGRSR